MHKFIKLILLLLLIWFRTGQAIAVTVSVDSVSADSITISSDHSPSWKLSFDANYGGMMSSLLVPSSSSSNLIETAASSNTLYGMGLVVRNSATAYCDSSAVIRLLEATSTRIVVMVKGDLITFSEGACTTTDEGDFQQTYYLYPDRIIVSGLFSTPTAGSGLTGPYLNFVPDSFDSNAYIFDNDTAPISISSQASVQTNVDINYADPGIGLVLTGASAGAGTSNDYILTNIRVPEFVSDSEFWYQNDVSNDMYGFISDDALSGGQMYSYAYSFRITGDNTTDGSEAKLLSQDIWNPDNLGGKITADSLWNSTSELTDLSGSDYYNEDQSLYPFVGDPNLVVFKLNGATYQRFNPVFKIRNWRRTSLPSTFELDNDAKTISTDYNADFLPFSQAWFYDDSVVFKQIASAGLTSNADEYLADNENSVSFNQDTYRIFDNTNDYLYLGANSQFSGVNLTLDTKGEGSGLITVWQYCSANLDEDTPCDTWTNLSISETALGAGSFTNSGSIYFTMPAVWKKATVNGGQSLYYLRTNRTSGSFASYPIIKTAFPDIILTQYLDTISSENQTFEIYHKPNPSLTFTISGVGANTLTNGITTNLASEYYNLPFGNLSVSLPKYGAHQLTVTNTADYGYNVSMKLIYTLQGNNPENNLDTFAADNVSWENPQAWSSPTGIVKNVNTGWIGANTSDTRVDGWSNGSGKFGPVSAISHLVMSSRLPETESKSVYVTYAIESNVYQPPDLYAGTLVYSILPVY